MLKQANLEQEWWSYACRFAGHMMREKILGRQWQHPLFGQLVGPDLEIPRQRPGSMRGKWLLSIYKDVEDLLQNMAITDADPALVIKWKNLGKWPLPCQMVFVLKPLTQVQQSEDDENQDYKHKSRLVICGNFASWGEHSAATTNLDAPLLRLMLSLLSSPDTTWSSIDITSGFLSADIHEEDIVLVTPPPILVKWTCQAQHRLACQESHLWLERASTPMAEGERPEDSRTRIPLSRQACSFSAKSHSSKYMVHCRRCSCRTQLDSTICSLSSK